MWFTVLMTCCRLPQCVVHSVDDTAYLVAHWGGCCLGDHRSRLDATQEGKQIWWVKYSFNSKIVIQIV